MATILKNILSFTGLVVGVPVALPHRLNVNGIPALPRTVEPDVGGFTVAANTTSVTITRQVGAPAAVNVLVEFWHSVEAVVPLVPPPGQLIGQVPWIQQPGGGGGGTTFMSNCLIYRPGSGLTGPIVFDTWAGLIAQLATLRAAGNNGGCYTIQFDDSITSPCVVPTGAYDMTDVMWEGTAVSSYFPKTPITLADGLVLTGMRRFRNVAITNTGGSSPITDFPPAVTGSMLLEGTDFLTGGLPIVVVTSAVFDIRLADNSHIDSPPVMSFQGTASGNIWVGEGSTIFTDALISAGGTTTQVNIMGSSGQVDENQPSVAGAFVVGNDTKYRQFPTQLYTQADSPIFPDPQEQVLIDNLDPGNIEVRLPDIPGYGTTRGQSIVVKLAPRGGQLQGNEGTVTVVPDNGTDTIDGATSFSLTEPFQSVTFVSDGVSDWHAITNSANRYSQPWAQCRFNYPTIEAGYNIAQIIEVEPGDWFVEFKASIDTGIDEFFFQAIAVNNTFPAFCVDGGAPGDPTKQIHVQAFRGDESQVNVTVKLTVWVVPIIPD